MAEVRYCQMCKGNVIVTQEGACPMGHALDGSSSSLLPAPPAIEAFEPMLPPEPPRPRLRDNPHVRLFGLSFAAAAAFCAVVVGFYLVFVSGASAEDAIAESTQAFESIESVSFTMLMELTSDRGAELALNASGTMSPKTGDLQMTASTDYQEMAFGFDEIVVDGVLYMRPSGSRVWISSPIEQTQPNAVSTSDPAGYLDYIKAFASVKKLSSQTVFGVPCDHYRIDIDKSKLTKEIVSERVESGSTNTSQTELELKKALKDVSIEAEIWIGKEDNLLRRQVITMHLHGMTSATVKVTLNMAAYDVPFEAKAPPASSVISATSRPGGSFAMPDISIPTVQSYPTPSPRTYTRPGNPSSPPPATLQGGD